MKNIDPNRIIPLSDSDKKMLLEVIENVKDKELFTEKKEAIYASLDVEKSKEGVLRVEII